MPGLKKIQDRIQDESVLIAKSIFEQPVTFKDIFLAIVM